jgi:hypothetical protein
VGVGRSCCAPEGVEVNRLPTPTAEAAKALIEADAIAGRTPPPDLRERVVRALWGYLTAKVPPA